ncbi:MAG: MipA/OmpV family protein [Sphingomonadaceae bacterium]
MRRVGLALLLSAPLPALAQTVGPPSVIRPGPQEDDTRLTIGFALGAGPRYEGSDDYRLRPGGLFQGSIEGFDFAARGTNLSVDLLRETSRAKVDFVFGPLFQLRAERTKASSITDSQVRALGSIKPAFELGLAGGIGISRLISPFDKLTVEVAATHDVSGIHRSTIVTPSVSYQTPLSRRTLAIVGVAADHVGAKYGQRYFGVTPTGSAASGLPTYTIENGGFKSAGGTLLLAQGLGSDPRVGLSVFALGGYSELLGKYRHSPIVAVGRTGSWFGFAGLAYTF